MPLPTYLRNQFNHCFAFYFGGARSKGFATLRNVSKLTFFDKIGHAKSVGFEFNSAIWRSKSRISSRYLEITSSTLIFPRKKELLFWLYRGFNRLTCVTRQIGETLNWGISRLRYCEPKNLGVSILVIECALRAGSSDLVVMQGSEYYQRDKTRWRTLYWLVREIIQRTLANIPWHSFAASNSKGTNYFSARPFSVLFNFSPVNKYLFWI